MSYWRTKLWLQCAFVQIYTSNTTSMSPGAVQWMNALFCIWPDTHTPRKRLPEYSVYGCSTVQWVRSFIFGRIHTHKTQNIDRSKMLSFRYLQGGPGLGPENKQQGIWILPSKVVIKSLCYPATSQAWQRNANIWSNKAASKCTLQLQTQPFFTNNE